MKNLVSRETATGENHPPAYKELWHTARLDHLIHTATMLAAPAIRHPQIFGGLLTSGIIAFSGTQVFPLPAANSMSVCGRNI